MKRKEYTEYEQAVVDFFEREGINCLSQKYDTDGYAEEDEFSWHQCECCGTTLGGRRHTMTGFVPALEPGQNPAYPNGKGAEVLEYEVCSDCWYYIEAGQLDD